MPNCIRLFATPVLQPEYWSRFFLLQRIFPTQGSNPCLLHCGQILYLLSHWGSPSHPLLLLNWQVDSLPLSQMGSLSIPDTCPGDTVAAAPGAPPTTAALGSETGPTCSRKGRLSTRGLEHQWSQPSYTGRWDLHRFPHGALLPTSCLESQLGFLHAARRETLGCCPEGAPSAGLSPPREEGEPSAMPLVLGHNQGLTLQGPVLARSDGPGQRQRGSSPHM